MTATGALAEHLGPMWCRAPGTAGTPRCDAPRGHVDRPAGAALVRAKFDDCAAFGGMSDPAGLRTALEGLRGSSARDALRPLGPR